MRRLWVAICLCAYTGGHWTADRIAGFARWLGGVAEMFSCREFTQPER